MNILVEEEDSNTIKKVRESMTHDVEKWLDKVHAKRSFGTYKRITKGILNVKVINYLLAYFGYALSQNKGNVQGLQKNLRAIVPHAI